MKVEVYSDKFVTKQNPSGRRVVETSDPKVRKLLGEKVVAELEGGGEEDKPKAARRGVR